MLCLRNSRAFVWSCLRNCTEFLVRAAADMRLLIPPYGICHKNVGKYFTAWKLEVKHVCLGDCFIFSISVY